LFFLSALLLLAGCSNRLEQKSDNAWSSMEDIADKRIGVLLSSIQDVYMTKHYPKSSILRIDMTSDLVLALQSGQCDAIILPEIEAKPIMELNPQLKVLNENLFSGELGIGFRDEGMRNSFNDFLSEIRTNGLYQEMEYRWIENTDEALMPDLEFPLDAKPIVVGTTAQGMPFSYIQDGVFSGFDLEMVSRFAQKEQRPVRFEMMSFGGLIPSLISGKIDIIANSIMITPERKKSILFSDPYYLVASSVLVLEKNLSKKTEIKSIKDGSNLATSTVGAMSGTTGEMFIISNYPNAKLFVFEEIMDAMAALQAEKIDYAITSYTTALLASKKNQDIKILPKEYLKDPAAIAVNLDNPQLLERINVILRKFKENGTLEQIIDRWINKDGEAYLGVENIVGDDAPILRVATSLNQEPMCFVRENQIVGLDCELIERIAVELGMRIEYLSVSFSGLINAIQTKRADVIIANFTETEERAKNVAFSEEYFDNPLVLITRNPVLSKQQHQYTGCFPQLKESFYNNIVLEKRWKMIIDGLKSTLIITFFSAIFGTVLGGIICFFRMSRRKLLSNFAKLYINIMRGTPVLLLLMIFFYVIFASVGISATIVAIVTFALNVAASTSEIFRTSIEGVDSGQSEAGIAVGFTKFQTFIHIVIPQAIKKIIPVYKGEMVSLLKMTSIVGYIAIVDLTKASDIIRSRTFDAFFPLIIVAIIYFVLAWFIGLGLDYINKKTSSAK